MSTLAALKGYLLTLPFVERDHFEAEQVDDGEIVPSMTLVDQANETYLLYRELYTAVLYFEAWTQPKELLLSNISAWLLESGGRRDETDLGWPTCEPLRNDDGSFDLMITIRFSESVYIQPANDGDLLIQGRKWQRVLLSPETALEFGLDGA